MRAPKHPAFALLWLVMIPVQIILDFAMVSLGVAADVSMANPEAYGHPAPGFVILATAVAVIFTIIIPLISVAVTIIRFVILKKRYQKFKAGMV